MSENNRNEFGMFGPFGDGFDREELERMMRDMFGQAGGIDADSLAKAMGAQGGSTMMHQLFSALQQAAQQPGDDGIDWSVARSTAASPDLGLECPSEAQREAAQRAITQAFSVANLWLDEVTEMGVPAEAPRTMSRSEWVHASFDTWVELAQPVAEAIAAALTSALSEQLPEQMQTVVPQLTSVLNSVGGVLFATQLGGAIGKLSGEVLSGGDIGVPLFSRQTLAGGSMLTDNVALFADGLEQPVTDVAMYLTVRELAHARLFRHAQWLAPHVVSAVTDYARGISIDSSHIVTISEDVDPSRPEEIEELLRSGSLIPPKTPAQEAALARLETLLALIEGWVDAVTAQAVSRMPGAEAIAEMVRRRRATGGPAERAFATLVGLELRPRRLREAARMWNMVAERGDAAARDRLWEHPDILPSAEEIDRPALLLERLGLAGAEPETVEDDFDRALAELLDAAAHENAQEHNSAEQRGSTDAPDTTGAPGSAGASGSTDEQDSADGDEPAPPTQ